MGYNWSQDWLKHDDPDTMVGTVLIATVKVEKVLFPKEDISSGDFTYHCFIGILEEVMGGGVPIVMVQPSRDGEHFSVRFTGKCPRLEIGKEYDIKGKLVEGTGKYKGTFSFDVLEIESILEMDKMENLVKFVDYAFTPKQKEKLLASGLPLITIFETENAEALMSIPGFGEKNVKGLFERYKQSKRYGAAYVKLHAEFGLTNAMIHRIMDAYHSGDRAIGIIKENPYTLIQDVRGIGWSIADGIAYKLGIADEDPRRIKAYILYFLENQAQTGGHTWVTNGELVEGVYGVAPTIESTVVVQCVQDLIQEERLYYESERRRIGLMKYRYIETQIAMELKRLQSCPILSWVDKEKVIRNVEKSVGFEYSDEQRRAIDMVLGSKVSLVTGLAGTGKTSSMLPLKKIFDKNKLKVGLCALSGKASLNLSNVVGIKGKTIHKLLGKKVDGRESAYGPFNPLPYDVIILDETSMVGEELFLELISAIKDGAILVMLGDTAQLEPIDVGGVLHDMVNSGQIPYIELTKIHRQGLKSAIITEAHAVRNKKSIMRYGFSGRETRGELQDLTIESAEDAKGCAKNILNEFVSIWEGKKIPTEDILIVAAKRSIGSASCYALNQEVQKICNPPAMGKKEYTIGYTENGTYYETTYRIGDRIIVNENMYQTKTVDDKTEPVFNGNIGTILSIETKRSKSGEEDIPEFVVSFLQGDIVLSGFQAIRGIGLGYAITCHKAQGSGYPYVLVAVDPTAYVLMTKEWLYTAITRAKKYCYLTGTQSIIEHACKTTQVYSKRTWLSELIINVWENWDSVKDEFLAERERLQEEYARDNGVLDLDDDV